MKLSAMLLLSGLLAGLAAPAAAQNAKPNPEREAAKKRCMDNRGFDCESEAGLREWLRQERPITPEEQKAAAGARRHREECARNKKGEGC